MKEENRSHTTSLKIVLIVKLENFRRQATVCATHVLLERNNVVHLAKHALPVNLAAVKQIPSVKAARKVFTKTSQEHRTACLVCLVNFKFPVANRLVINVQRTQQVKVPIQPPANHVTLEKIPSPAVLNVPRVVRVHLALGVKLARWVMPEKETTLMQRNVNNVNWAKQQRAKVPLNAMLVMPGNLGKPKVSVTTAQLDFIKMTRVKTNASNAHWENRTLMPKQHAVVVALVRLAATKASAKSAQLDSIKIPKEKQSAVKPATRQQKYPTTKAPGVSCHRGVPVKWANI